MVTCWYPHEIWHEIGGSYDQFHIPQKAVKIGSRLAEYCLKCKKKLHPLIWTCSNHCLVFLYFRCISLHIYTNCKSCPMYMQFVTVSSYYMYSYHKIKNTFFYCLLCCSVKTVQLKQDLQNQLPIAPGCLKINAIPIFMLVASDSKVLCTNEIDMVDTKSYLYPVLWTQWSLLLCPLD